MAKFILKYAIPSTSQIQLMKIPKKYKLAHTAPVLDTVHDSADMDQKTARNHFV